MSSPERTLRTSLPAFSGLLFLAGIAVWGFYLTGDEADRAWRAFLVNFLYFTPLAAGLVTWSAVVLASKGKWPGETEGITLCGLGFALPSLLAFGALWAGSPHWSPWYEKSFRQGLWLDNTFVFARDAALLLLFWIFAWIYRRRRRQGGGETLAGWLILLYGIVFSLIGFDLGMGLDPKWTSSLFGGYFFVTGMYVAVAAWALLAALRHKDLTDKLHDLGKLVFAFAILSTYMMYSQLLPIYYENLPYETRFVLPRLSWPWKGVSIALLATIYLGPLVLLLTVRAKRSRIWLGGVALLVLAGMWVERWWIVAPLFDPRPRFGLVELASLIAFLGAAGVGMGLAQGRSPGFSPERGDG